MSDWYDRQGRPISMAEWTRLFHSPEYQRLARTQVSDDVMVSTVWLGMDHSFGLGDDSPVIFETMIFGGPLDQDEERYSTEEEALAGHEAMVRRARDPYTVQPLDLGDV